MSTGVEFINGDCPYVDHLWNRTPLTSGGHGKCLAHGFGNQRDHWRAGDAVKLDHQPQLLFPSPTLNLRLTLQRGASRLKFFAINNFHGTAGASVSRADFLIFMFV